MRGRYAANGASGVRTYSHGKSAPSIEPLEARRLLTIAFQFDYTYDTGGFFTADRRTVLQAAGNALASRLLDTLDAIPAPSGSNTWTAGFLNPTDGTTQEQIVNLQVPADTLIIYVGGRTFSDPNQLGVANTSYSFSGDNTWNNLIKSRGEAGALAASPTDVGPWGGSIGFDSSSGANWYFGLDGAVPSGQADFFTVAQHEIGHLLGFNSSSPGAWTALVSGGSFTGAAAQAAYGGPVPADAATGHWTNGTLYNSGPVTMDPSSDSGRRTAFTTLDFAALDDIGWDIGNNVPAPGTPARSAAPRSTLFAFDSITELPIPGGFVEDTSTTTTLDGKIYQAGRDGSNHIYIESSTDNGASFGNRETLAHTSNHAPALRAHLGGLVLAFAGTDGNLYLDFKADPFKPNWSATPIDTGADTNAGPALTSIDDGSRLRIGWTDPGGDRKLAAVVFIGKTAQPLQVFPLSNGVLSIDGDQRDIDFDDMITIESIAAGGVKVTLNDNSVEFASGALTGIVVNTGGGNNLINLLDELAGVPITINGGGTDKLVLDPALPGALFTPGPGGLSGYGTLAIGGATVHLAGLEFVTPVAPASVLLTSADIDENGLATLTGSFTDPGSFSTHTVSIDWGDGTIGGPTALLIGTRGFSAAHQYLDDNPTGTASDTYTIEATVTDNDSLSDDGSTPLKVSNIEPVLASFSGTAPSSSPGSEGQPLNVSGTFSDVGTLDTHTATIDWNDGTTSAAQLTEAGGSGSFSAQHTFAAGGIYTVGVNLVDDDTGADAASETVFVTGVGVQQLNGKKTLVVVGSNANDEVQVDRTKAGFRVRASFLTRDRVISDSGIEIIEIVLLDGNDRASIPSTISVPAIFDGGAGADTFQGGGGGNILIGGAGADQLIGGSGRDILIGGAGADRLIGNSNDDILISGTTSYDSGADANKIANDGILLKLFDEWTSIRSYLARVGNLRGGTGPVLAGTGRSLTAGVTVFNDADKDQLTGSSGIDWFFVDRTRDKLSDQAIQELVETG